MPIKTEDLVDLREKAAQLKLKLMIFECQTTSVSLRREELMNNFTRQASILVGERGYFKPASPYTTFIYVIFFRFSFALPE